MLFSCGKIEKYGNIVWCCDCHTNGTQNGGRQTATFSASPHISSVVSHFSSALLALMHRKYAAGGPLSLPPPPPPPAPSPSLRWSNEPPIRVLFSKAWWGVGSTQPRSSGGGGGSRPQGPGAEPPLGAPNEWGCPRLFPKYFPALRARYGLCGHPWGNCCLGRFVTGKLPRGTRAEWESQKLYGGGWRWSEDPQGGRGTGSRLDQTPAVKRGCAKQMRNDIFSATCVNGKGLMNIPPAASQH